MCCLKKGLQLVRLGEIGKKRPKPYRESVSNRSALAAEAAQAFKRVSITYGATARAQLVPFPMVATVSIWASSDQPDPPRQEFRLPSCGLS